MVLLPPRYAPDGWELLRGAPASSIATLKGLAKSRAASSAGPVLIFASAEDPDALAAVRVLTALLKADFTRYEVHPVSGYSHLRDKFEVLAKGPNAVEPRAVLCVNCGAAVDLEHVLGLREEDEESEQTDVRLFVMDCHRPYHLRNIKSERVVLFDDLEEFKTDGLPLDVGWEDEWGNVAEDDSSDEESDESDLSDEEEEDSVTVEDYGDDERESRSQQNTESSDDKSRTHKRKRRRRSRRVRDDDLEEIEKDDVVFDDDGESRDSSGLHDEDSSVQNKEGGAKRRALKRARTGRRMRSRLERHEDDPEEEERERLREYYANSSIAMSSACLSHSIASVMRRANIDTLWMAILGVTSQYIASGISDGLYEDALGYFQNQIPQVIPSGEGEDRQTSRVQNVGYATTCNSSQVQRIAQSVELRLDLLRHWSLHDSLVYSTYTATRLASWRQTGKRKLLEMLATLGIPLKESRQQWCYMQQKNKYALEKYLHKAIRRFDLGEGIQYDSFVRSLPGHKGDISAADYAHVVTALLEFNDFQQKDRKGNFSGSLLDRFWRAYDALDSRRVVLLESGLEMAVFVQKLTADIAGDIIERRKFVPSGPFRYTFLRDQQCKEFLSQPLLLRRLALFLTKALIRQGARDKPFIVIAPDVVKSVWIAVAATTPGQKNDFGHRFRKAAERNGSQVTYDGFDSSVCEIRDGQEVEFVRFLHDVMR